MDFLWAVGEVGTTYSFTLQDATGAVIDLTGRTVTLKYKAYPTPGSTTSRSCTVSDAANGVVTYTLVTADTSAAGEFSYDFEITSSGYLDVIPKSNTLHTFAVVSKV